MNRTRRQHPLPSHSTAVVAEFASRGITDLSRVFEYNALRQWGQPEEGQLPWELKQAYYTSDLEEMLDEPGRLFHVYEEEDPVDGKMRIRSYTYVDDGSTDGKYRVFDGERVFDINDTYFE